MERLEEWVGKDLEDDAQMAKYTQLRAAEIRAAIQQGNVKDAQDLLLSVLLLPEPYPRWVIEKLNKERKTGPKDDPILKWGRIQADRARQILREYIPAGQKRMVPPSQNR